MSVGEGKAAEYRLKLNTAVLTFGTGGTEVIRGGTAPRTKRLRNYPALEAPDTGHHAFGKAVASDGALRHKGDACLAPHCASLRGPCCLRSPHRNLRLRRGPQNNPAANMQ